MTTINIATIAIDADLKASMPTPPSPAQPFKDWSGFQLTITAMATGVSAPPVLTQNLTWKFSFPLDKAGLAYRVAAKSVDLDGRVIQDFGFIELTVPSVAPPPAQTYGQIKGLSVVWTTENA